MRVETADRLKAVCIMLMIVGHCEIPQALHDFIYLFHIPMFFFIAGLFFREASPAVRLRKDTRQLLVTYLVGTLVVLLKYAADGFRTSDFSVASHFVQSIFLVGPMGSSLLDGFFDVGPLWFLPALFFCRTFFNFGLRFFHSPWIPLILGFLFCVVSIPVVVPFGIEQGVSAMFYFGAGYFFSQEPGLSRWRGTLPVALIVACTGFLVPPIDMHAGIYPMPVVSALASLGMVILLWKLAFLFESKTWIPLRLLSYCGKVSIMILLVHGTEAMAVDVCGKLCELPLPLVVVVRVVFDVSIACVLSRIAFVRKILCLR